MMMPCCVGKALKVGELEVSSVAGSPANALARPKSRTFTRLAGVTFTLAGLRSR